MAGNRTRNWSLHWWLGEEKCTAFHTSGGQGWTRLSSFLRDSPAGEVASSKELSSWELPAETNRDAYACLLSKNSLVCTASGKSLSFPVWLWHQLPDWPRDSVLQPQLPSRPSSSLYICPYQGLLIPGGRKEPAQGWRSKYYNLKGYQAYTIVSWAMIYRTKQVKEEVQFSLAKKEEIGPGSFSYSIHSRKLLL